MLRARVHDMTKQFHDVEYMEIKVLNKVFDLLEFAAEVSPRPLLPGEAAERCGMPRSTCVRLLKLLSEKGYLEQLSPRKGYTLGPAAALLNGGCYQQLAFHGERLLRSFAAELKISVQLSLRQGNCRLILCGFDGDPGLNLDLRRIRRYDLQRALSGRVLLSHAPEAEQRQIIGSWGEDRGVFADVSDGEILAQLRELSRQSLLCCEHHGKYAAVVPLRVQGRVAAAAGAVWRPDRMPHAQEITGRLKNTVELIEGYINVESF